MRRRVIALMLWGAVVAAWPPGGARAADVQADSKVIGQVRDSFQTGDTEAPFWLYSDLGINRLRHGINGEGYFSLNENFGPNYGGGDFYAGAQQSAPSTSPAEERLRFLDLPTVRQEPEGADADGC